MRLKHTCTKATLILDIISPIREKKYIVTKINHAVFTLISCSGISKAKTVGDLHPTISQTSQTLFDSLFPWPQGTPKEHSGAPDGWSDAEDRAWCSGLCWPLKHHKLLLYHMWLHLYLLNTIFLLEIPHWRCINTIHTRNLFFQIFQSSPFSDS